MATRKTPSSTSKKSASAPSSSPKKPPRKPTKTSSPKNASAKEASPQKTKLPKDSAPRATSATRDVWRLKVICMAGPYWDTDGADVCVRTIDVLSTTSLYDLHAAILESVHFEEHDESVFTFFTAMDHRGRRTYLGDGKPLSKDTNIEQFEDLSLANSLPTGGRQFLFYVFDADDPWVFLIGRDPTTRSSSPHEFYPLVRDELNRGPDPIQHGDGLDDFADVDEGEEFHELQGEFRKQRKIREESGLDEDEFEEFPADVERGFFSSDEGEDSFFDEDDEENMDPYSSGFDRDDW